MKTLKIIGAGLLAGMVLSCTTKSRTVLGKSPLLAAQSALTAFKNAMDDSLAKHLGFASLEEGKASRLGEPIRVYNMSCASIQRVKDSARSVDPRMLADREEFYVPIQDAQGRNHSLILVDKLNAKDGYGKAGDWSPVLVGASSFAKKLDSALLSQSKARLSTLFLAQSPVMGASFLGFEENGSVNLKPVALSPSVDSCMKFPTRQEALPASQLLAALGGCFSPDICAEFDPDSAEANPKKWGWTNQKTKPDKGMESAPGK